MTRLDGNPDQKDFNSTRVSFLRQNGRTFSAKRSESLSGALDELPGEDVHVDNPAQFIIFIREEDDDAHDDESGAQGAERRKGIETDQESN